MSGENVNRKIHLYINDREIVNAANSIDAALRKVRNEKRNLVKGTEDYDKQLKLLLDTEKKLIAEQTRYRSELAQTKGILGQIKDAIGPVASGFLTAFSITSVVDGFTNKIREGWQMVTAFDQKQADLAGTMQKTRAQIAGLTLDAIKYGASSAYSASEVSDLQNELAKLGKTAPEIKAMTKDVLNAATALDTDLANAAVLVGGQLNSYGENANQAGKYSDIMANSVNISATSYEYLATSLPKVSAVAAQNNVTFEKLNATMGVLADQNVQAETAGTGFRNILLEAAKAGKPYQVMLDEVKNSADQSKKAVELFGKENATVAVILANSTEKINSNTEALKNSAGSAERLAKEKLDSIKGSVESFSGAWEGFVLSLEKGDGKIAKAVRGIIDLGTSFLNLITPMERVSDQLQKEQLDLNMLVGKITSTNISNEERSRLMSQLAEQYPDFVKNIDLETASNDDLTKALNKVNEQYIKRIALQKQVENVEDAQNSVGSLTGDKLALQEKLFKQLNESKVAYNLPIKIDFGNLEKSAEQVKKALKAKGVEDGFLGDIGYIDSYVSRIQAFDLAINKARKELDEETKTLDRQQKSLGINTEAQNEANKAAAEQVEILKKLRAEAKALGMANSDKATESELKVWIAAYKERMKYKGQESEEDRKKREKAIEDAKKHTEDLKKQLEVSEKELLDTRRSFQDANLANLKDGYEKERILLNQEYDRKIEDLKIKIDQEQKEIDKLRVDLKDPKNSKSDVALLQKQIDNKIQLQKIYSDTSVSIEQTRNIKLAQLQEKYLNEDIKRSEAAFKKNLSQLKARQDAELAGINTLAEAKNVLEDYLSEEELSKVKNLQDAKQRIKEEHLKEEYKMQEEYLLDMIAQINAIFLQEELTGIPIISEEERAALLEFLDEAALKLGNLTSGKKNLNEGDNPDISTLSGIDILGFNPEQWQNAFDSLDTWAEKLEAVGTVIGGLKNAFATYFQFVDASDRRSLQKFEANSRKKQKELSDQLEKGYITQEIYNARKDKLDNDLAKKRAELEYKQAKREKLMNIASIISNTAMGVSKALAQGGFVLGIPWAAIVGALGAVQLAAAIAQPLPSKEGFHDGGYTGDGPEWQSPGPAHYGEYYVPKKVLFSDDPIVPSIVGYLEAKRTGKVTAATSSGDYATGANNSQAAASSVNDSKMAELMDRVATVLETIEEEGIPAFLVNDLKTAKDLRKKQRELENLENQTKR